MRDLTGHVVDINDPSGEESGVRLFKKLWYDPYDKDLNDGKPVLFLDDGYAIRELVLSNVVESTDGLTATTQSGYQLKVRPMSESDVFHLTPMITYPVPVAVINGMLNGDNMPTLEALVDDEGDVMTLMLSTDQGIYLRFSNSWHYLTPGQEPDPIDGYTVVSVGNNAVDVYDSVDSRGLSSSIVKYPLAEGEAYFGPVRDDDSSVMNAEGTVDIDTVTSAASIVSRGQSAYPVVASLDDIDAAIEEATVDPSIRWYVEKRVRALGSNAEIPWSI